MQRMVYPRDVHPFIRCAKHPLRCVHGGLTGCPGVRWGWHLLHAHQV